MQSGLVRVPAALEGTTPANTGAFFSRCTYCYIAETIEFPNHLIMRGLLSRRGD